MEALVESVGEGCSLGQPATEGHPVAAAFVVRSWVGQNKGPSVDQTPLLECVLPAYCLRSGLMRKYEEMREGLALVLLLAGLVSGTGAAEPLRALQRYPVLAETFPFGFWYSQAPMDEDLAGAFQESYEVRREKLFHHLARHFTNVLITANRVADAKPLDVAGRYGIRIISSAEFLHSHINHAGEVTGGATMEQVLEQAAASAGQNASSVARVSGLRRTSSRSSS